MNLGQTNTINELSAYDFDLPDELIARYPSAKRDQSRLLHYNLNSRTVKHLSFPDIRSLLRAGDVLVLNKTKVMPARFYLKALDKTRQSVKSPRGAQGIATATSSPRDDVAQPPRNDVEILLTARRGDKWEAIAKPLKKLKDGERYLLRNEQEVLISRLASSSEMSAQILVDFLGDFDRAVSEAAEMPIPPYFKRHAEDIDRERYQTVYAEDSSSGFSVAAPTAGLHFTPEILSELAAIGVEILELTLHVGLGTFLPIKSDTIAGHKMHSEYYEISDIVWQRILAAKNNGRRVIGVGSTATRALESAAASGALQGETDIYIYPPYKFRAIDGMLTNFHLPRSTLLLMVAALTGRDEVMNIYKEAVEQRYRFYSYGDCMLIA